MALTQAQKALIERARAAGGGELGARLSDGACVFIIATIANDLNLLKNLPELPKKIPGFFQEPDPRKLEITGLDFYALIDRLLNLVPDADTYFAGLAILQRSRLKYARILEAQPIPTMDQVGPRALLQYGQMSPDTLAAFLLWRKWIFDIDNRAAQETGYLFQPIIADAIGGASFSSQKSPIKRHNDPTKARQVDCIRKDFAYEIKIRVTIAASGQGRWQEELDFPIDCTASGYKPVLLVLDPTPNPKLTELVAAFKNEGGLSYVGDQAWNHLETAAGKVMSVFIEKYVKAPIKQVLQSTPTALPEITLALTDDTFSVSIENETAKFKRAPRNLVEPDEE